MNLEGKRFGKLVVMKLFDIKKYKKYWLCKCDCGGQIVVRDDCLKRNVTHSCGCLKHKHDLSECKLYKVWVSIKSRCLNKDDRAFKNYGGRGITMCKEWKNSFQTFYDWAMENGYESGLSIDRIDVNGNYCPENCRWATSQEQLNNTRRNHFVEYKGEKHTIAEWGRIVGLSRALIENRIMNYKWTAERALTTPVIRRSA